MNLMNQLNRPCLIVGRFYLNSIRSATIIRKPIKVLTEDGKDYDSYRGAEGKVTNPDEYLDEDDEVIKEKSEKFKQRRFNPNYARKRLLLRNRDDVIKRDTEFINTITRLNSKKSKSQEIILEGQRLIDDATFANAKIKKIYYDSAKSLKHLKCLEQLKISGTELTIISRKEIDNFSHVVTSSGLIAIAEKPTPEDVHNSDIYQKEKVRLPVTLILNNVSDPGNMGTIIRTAAAAGLSKILCSPKCVNIWDPKVLRSAVGSHFRIPVHNCATWPDLIEHLVNNNTRLYYAKQSETSSEHEAPLYSDINYFKDRESAALLIGGEAHGYSEEAKELIDKLIGQQLSIPLAHQIESLNSAIASAIIMYEMRRQFVARR